MQFSLLTVEEKVILVLEPSTAVTGGLLMEQELSVVAYTNS